MITNRKFIVAYFICFLLYLLPEIFANDALLYLSGGTIGGTIKEVFNINNNVIIFSIWIALTVGLVAIYFYLKTKWLKYLVLLLIAFALNIINNLVAFIPIFDLDNQEQAKAVNYIVMFIEILIKSSLLSCIYYKGNKD